MKLFLDTEFTGLSRPPEQRKLISLAIVAEDGVAEWYAELDGWEPGECDPWVQANVLPHLNGKTTPDNIARQELRAWFGNLGKHVQVACDSGFDWSFLLHLLGERPANLDAQHYDLTSLLANPTYRRAFTDYFTTGRPEHHALHEARAHRCGWVAWHSAMVIPAPPAIQLRLDLR